MENIKIQKNRNMRIPKLLLSLLVLICGLQLSAQISYDELIQSFLRPTSNRIQRELSSNGFALIEEGSDDERWEYLPREIRDDYIIVVMSMENGYLDQVTISSSQHPIHEKLKSEIKANCEYLGVEKFEGRNIYYQKYRQEDGITFRLWHEASDMGNFDVIRVN